MKKFKIISSLYFLTLIIFISNNLFSQITGSIKGVVRDSASGEMLPFVSIQVVGTKIGTVTNNNGLYFLKGIPKGYQTIQASAVGYKKITKKIIIEKEEIQTVNFNLPSEAVELQSVTKIADRIIENYSTNISLQKISIEDMKSIPSVLEKDIFRALRSVPGVSTTGDVTSQFFVRGGKGDQNLIIYDNMIIFNPFHALGLFSIFDAEAIKSSEIYTGGFDPEFGGKLSSVINITSKDGNRNKY
ncbi:MAG TPA: TonB-dependent receptor, partial [Ignavibacteriaceae bacterium]|nr:TonB-dependent receptor [Ignavibacteriaceae bacterium]